MTSPRDTEVVAGMNVTLLCLAKTDPHEAANLTISWLRNHQPIPWIYTEFQQNQNGSLSMVSTKGIDSGTYTCVASNGIDNATASAVLTVKGKENWTGMHNNNYCDY